MLNVKAKRIIYNVITGHRRKDESFEQQGQSFQTTTTAPKLFNPFPAK
jgi:hypothetical protein